MESALQRSVGPRAKPGTARHCAFFIAEHHPPADPENGIVQLQRPRVYASHAAGSLLPA
jgi:hypothetical protein